MFVGTCTGNIDDRHISSVKDSIILTVGAFIRANDIYIYLFISFGFGNAHFHQSVRPECVVGKFLFCVLSLSRIPTCCVVI